MRLSILSLAVLSAVLLVGPQCHGPRQIAMAQDPAPSPGPVPTPVPVPPAPKAVVIGPTEPQAFGDLICLDGSQSVGSGHCWKLIGSSKTFKVTDGGTQVMFATGTAGTYRFVMSVAVDGKSDITEFDVVVSSPQPDPTPTPTPNPPTPNPTPTAKQLFVTVVTDVNTTPAQLAVFNDPVLISNLKLRTHEYGVYGSIMPQAQKFVDYINQYKAKGGTSPLVIIQDNATGEVLAVAPAPGTVADFTAFVASFEAK